MKPASRYSAVWSPSDSEPKTHPKQLTYCKGADFGLESVSVLYTHANTSINTTRRFSNQPPKKSDGKKQARHTREQIPKIRELPGCCFLFRLDPPASSIRPDSVGSVTMMNPEMMRLAEEQMSRMSTGDLAKMQQQLMSNPELVKLASESMKNMSTEDFKRAAQQLNQTRPEEILRMTENIAKAKPEEFAAMKAQADAQMSYAISGGKMLKQQGNELHSRGQYADAAAKYKLAKDNVKSVENIESLIFRCIDLTLTGSIYRPQFEECVNEGSEVLTYDTSNVKAYYRRGQAYKELGNLEASVADLSNAHEISPEDETIAQVLRDAEEELAIEGEGTNLPKGVVIEEIVEKDNFQPSSPQNVAESTDEINERMDQPPLSSPPYTADMQDVMRKFMEDPAMWQMLESMMKKMSGPFGIKPSEDAPKAQQAISSLSLEDLDRMMKWMDRARRGVEVAKKAKNWLIARKGLIIAIVMLIVAFSLHRLGL
uniref:Uncharacterized protein n=1 Tax=Avena sativa TaxID=4498 RepID=A0ACD5VML9_AVESA